MPRPKNADKYNPQAQREQLRVLVGEALTQLRKQIKKADVNTLANFVVKSLPLIINEDTQTPSDTTLELLTQKAINVQIRINNANKQNLTEEQIEDDHPNNTQ